MTSVIHGSGRIYWVLALVLLFDCERKPSASKPPAEVILRVPHDKIVGDPEPEIMLDARPPSVKFFYVKDAQAKQPVLGETRETLTPEQVTALNAGAKLVIRGKDSDSTDDDIVIQTIITQQVVPLFNSPSPMTGG